MVPTVARGERLLEVLVDAGVLDGVDAVFARTVARLAGQPDDEPLLLGAALASVQQAHGDVCVALSEWAGQPIESPEGACLATLRWPREAQWLRGLRASPAVMVVSGGAPASGASASGAALPGADSSGTTPPGGSAAPLVLDRAGRLYLQRLWAQQERLAGRLHDWIRTPAFSLKGLGLGEALDRLFGPETRAPDHPAHSQRRAALLASLRPLVMITGGPGTGKTSTVLRVIALATEQAVAAGLPPPHIRLMAPTGKAAARLTEALRAGRESGTLRREVVDRLPTEASTIHRALGASLRAARPFRYHRHNPLPVDLCVVDEVSMVDLGLMAHLVDALPRRARLVLLGDRDQLASVEAGAVLGDLCPPKQTRGPVYSAALVRAALEASSDVLPAMGEGAAAGEAARAGEAPRANDALSLADCVAPLTYSFRFGAESGIGALSAAVVAGDVDEVIHLLRDPAREDLSWWEVPDASATLDGTWAPEDLAAWAPMVDRVVARAVDAYRALLPGARAGTAEQGVPRGGPDVDAVAEATMGARDSDVVAPVLERLARLDRFRVLCAHRRGPFAVEQLNPRIAARIRPPGARGRHFSGRIVGITSNHYDLRLWSGDVGLLLPDVRAGGALRAFFAGGDSGLRTFSPARLPAHDTVFATTVHKAQGSEYDEVLVVLPPRPSPVTTRELLYTAISRARERIHLVCTETVLRHAVEQRTRRASGLRDRLARPDFPPPLASIHKEPGP